MNQEGVWDSNDNWSFRTIDDDLIYIENDSKQKVLKAKSKDKVIEDQLVVVKDSYLWRKGEADNNGYFTLENQKFKHRYLNAKSANKLEIQSKLNCTLGLYSNPNPNTALDLYSNFSEGSSSSTHCTQMCFNIFCL